MEPMIPRCSQGALIDQDLLKQEAAQRETPLTLQQRRDEQGQFLSYKDVPPRATPDASSIHDAAPGTGVAK